MSPDPLQDHEPRAADWAAGGVVGRYTLLAKIATGGMAEIWLARQAGPQGFQKVVVVKRILDSFSEDEEFVEMFLDEARIAAQLNHPNIVQISDLGEHAGAFYMAMEYLAGQDLARVVRQGNKQGKPLPLAYAVRIAAQAAEGLSYAHGKLGLDGRPLGIVHRDVSPQNLIVTYDGVVKLVDFGIAKAANRATRTRAGAYKGKLSYMAPEQARGEPTDPRTDVFALGIVLWESVTRSRLFQFEVAAAALQAIAGTEPIRPAHEKNPEVPRDLSAIIAKALERDRGSRYPSAGAFQAELEGWLRKEAGAPGNTEIARYMRTLFADRIAKQAKLIESASQGEMSATQATGELGSGASALSMPGSGSLVAAPRSRLPLAAAILAAGLLGVLGLGALLWPGAAPPGAIPPQSIEPAASKPVVALPPVLPEPPAAVATPVAPQPAPVPPTVQPASQALPRAAPRPARGRLTLQTVPWTEVFLGARKLGDSPLVEVSLPAGRQTLRLVNAEKGVNTSITVEIRPGQTTLRKEKLLEAP
ncbi:MAG: serine/threonine-protein kinase [Myxococcaceae bacterium]